MEPGLWPTLADASRLLTERGIPFALIGGLAVSLRGQPRLTVDVDLVVLADVDLALQLVRELDATPFDPLFAGVDEVVSRAFILPIRHRETRIRVDLAIGMTGFEREAVARATAVAIGETRIPVVSVEDLLVMKALAGRPQDDQDIRGLVTGMPFAVVLARAASLAGREAAASGPPPCAYPSRPRTTVPCTSVSR